MSVKKSYHWRNNSGELDVFEASHYFSGANERVSRTSLDLIRNPNLANQVHEKNKQASSPRGKLASFLNSIFSQTLSSKKKKSKTCPKNLDQESPHKIRSSISHFRITASDEEFRFKNGSFKECSANKETGFRKFSDDDDGGDTDSSSDLFDLPNHDLDLYSSGLPVFGTTNMDRIRIGAPISSAAAV